METRKQDSCTDCASLNDQRQLDKVVEPRKQNSSLDYDSPIDHSQLDKDLKKSLSALDLDSFIGQSAQANDNEPSIPDVPLDLSSTSGYSQPVKDIQSSKCSGDFGLPNGASVQVNDSRKAEKSMDPENSIDFSSHTSTSVIVNESRKAEKSLDPENSIDFSSHTSTSAMINESKKAEEFGNSEESLDFGSPTYHSTQVDEYRKPVTRCRSRSQKDNPRSQEGCSRSRTVLSSINAENSEVSHIKYLGIISQSLSSLCHSSDSVEIMEESKNKTIDLLTSSDSYTDHSYASNDTSKNLGKHMVSGSDSSYHERSANDSNNEHSNATNGTGKNSCTSLKVSKADKSTQEKCGRDSTQHSCASNNSRKNNETSLKCSNGNKRKSKRNESKEISVDKSDSSKIKYLGIVTQTSIKPKGRISMEIKGEAETLTDICGNVISSVSELGQSLASKVKVKPENCSQSLLQQPETNSVSKLTTKKVGMSIDVTEAKKNRQIHYSQVAVANKIRKPSTDATENVCRNSMDRQSDLSLTLSSDKSVISPSPEAEIAHMSPFSLMSNVSRLITTRITQPGRSIDHVDRATNTTQHLEDKSARSPVIANQTEKTTADNHSNDSHTTEGIQDGSANEKMITNQTKNTSGENHEVDSHKAQQVNDGSVLGKMFLSKSPRKNLEKLIKELERKHQPENKTKEQDTLVANRICSQNDSSLLENNQKGHENSAADKTTGASSQNESMDFSKASVEVVVKCESADTVNEINDKSLTSISTVVRSDTDQHKKSFPIAAAANLGVGNISSSSAVPGEAKPVFTNVLNKSEVQVAAEDENGTNDISNKLKVKGTREHLNSTISNMNSCAESSFRSNSESHRPFVEVKNLVTNETRPLNETEVLSPENVNGWYGKRLENKTTRAKSKNSRNKKRTRHQSGYPDKEAHLGRKTHSHNNLQAESNTLVHQNKKSKSKIVNCGESTSSCTKLQAESNTLVHQNKESKKKTDKCGEVHLKRCFVRLERLKSDTNTPTDSLSNRKSYKLKSFKGIVKDFNEHANFAGQNKQTRRKSKEINDKIDILTQPSTSEEGMDIKRESGPEIRELNSSDDSSISENGSEIYVGNTHSDKEITSTQTTASDEAIYFDSSASIRIESTQTTSSEENKSTQTTSCEENSLSRAYGLPNDVDTASPGAKPSSKWESIFYKWTKGYKKSGCNASQCSQCTPEEMNKENKKSSKSFHDVFVVEVSRILSKQDNEKKDKSNVAVAEGENVSSDPEPKTSNFCSDVSSFVELNSRIGKSIRELKDRIQKEKDKTPSALQDTQACNQNNDSEKNAILNESLGFDISPDILTDIQSYDTEKVVSQSSTDSSVNMPDILTGTQPFDKMSQTQGFVPGVVKRTSSSSSNEYSFLSPIEPIKADGSKSENSPVAKAPKLGLKSGLLNDTRNAASCLSKAQVDELLSEETRLETRCKPSQKGGVEEPESVKRMELTRTDASTPVRYRIFREKGRQKSNDDIQIDTKNERDKKDSNEGSVCNAVDRNTVDRDKNIYIEPDSCLIISSDSSQETILDKQERNNGANIILDTDNVLGKESSRETRACKPQIMDKTEKQVKNGLPVDDNMCSCSGSSVTTKVCKEKAMKVLATWKPLNLSSVNVQCARVKQAVDVYKNVLRVKPIGKDYVIPSQPASLRVSSPSVVVVSEESEPDFNTSRRKAVKTYGPKKAIIDGHEMGSENMWLNIVKSPYPKSSTLNKKRKLSNEHGRKKEILVRKEMDGVFRFVRVPVENSSSSSEESDSVNIVDNSDLASKHKSTTPVKSIERVPVKNVSNKSEDKDDSNETVGGSKDNVVASKSKLTNNNVPSKDIVRGNDLEESHSIVKPTNKENECQTDKADNEYLDTPCERKDDLDGSNNKKTKKEENYSKAASCDIIERKSSQEGVTNIHDKEFQAVRLSSMEAELLRQTLYGVDSKSIGTNESKSGKRNSSKRKHDHDETDNSNSKIQRTGTPGKEIQQQGGEISDISSSGIKTRRQETIDKFLKDSVKEKYREGMNLRSTFTYEWVTKQTFECLPSSDESQKSDSLLTGNLCKTLQKLAHAIYR